MKTSSGIVSELDTDGGIGISVLRTVLHCYKELKSRGESYLKDFAGALDIDAATLLRRVERFEQTIAERGHPGFKLFERQRGSKAKIKDDFLIESLIFDIAQIVESWEHLMGGFNQRMVVRLGMTLSAARFLMPILSRNHSDVWFDVTQTKPQRLLNLARRHRCDLVVTEVADDFKAFEGDSDPIDFQLAVLAPRGHWTEVEEPKNEDGSPFIWESKELWKALANKKDALCLLPEEPELYPLPDYPGPKELPKNLRILRIGSTTLCHVMVMSSLLTDAPILTISLPQFLTEEDLEHIHIVPVLLKSRPVRIALLRPNRPKRSSDFYEQSERKPKGPENPTRTETIAKIEAEVLEILRHKSAEYQPQLTKDFNSVATTTIAKWIYHTTIVGKEARWLSGRLWWRWTATRASLVEMVTGTHSGEVNGRQYQYLFRGRAVRNAEGNYHLVYRARLTGATEEDSYVVNCIYPSKKVEEGGVLVGSWHGILSLVKRAKSDNEYRAASGCVIISNQELELEDLMFHASRLKPEESILTASKMDHSFAKKLN